MNVVLKAGCLVLALLLAGCASQRSGAPVVDRPPGGSPAAPARPPVAQQTPVPQPSQETFYTVKRGDTLYSIALEHGADYREVAQWNYLDDPTKLRIGQQLRVKPPEDRAGVQVGPARAAGRVESRPLESAAQNVPSQPAPAQQPPPQQQAARADSESVDFIWPAKGKVLAGFSEPRSKGIDIDGKLGDPVVAAAAGRVTYIGTGIPGLGKLVVLKHENGFITVYAHNKEILVKEQQTVARGQRIAELGSSDSERPKLHFQIRKGAAAVDPLRYLPAS
jgi:lipoprotein NlpD